MSIIGRRGIHYLQKLKAANVPDVLIEKGQNRVIDASLTLIRERAKLKVYINFLNLLAMEMGCVMSCVWY